MVILIYKQSNLLQYCVKKSITEKNPLLQHSDFALIANGHM